jgi:hypothetical protein
LNSDSDRFLAFVASERRRYNKRLLTGSLVAVLIAVLLYETQWPDLWFGLTVLLAGQVADLLVLLARKVLNKAPGPSWFEREEVFIRRLALFETAYRTLGFLALGYAFWTSTRNLLLAFAIGVVYPLTLHFGMNRRRTLADVKRLRAMKESL